LPRARKTGLQVKRLNSAGWRTRAMKDESYFSNAVEERIGSIWACYDCGARWTAEEAANKLHLEEGQREFFVCSCGSRGTMVNR